MNPGKLFGPFVALLAVLISPVEAAKNPAESIKVGVVPQFSSHRIHATWQPLLHQLSLQTGLQFELQAAPTIPDFEQAFLRGEYDLAYMNPYHFLMAQEAQGYQPLLRDHARSLSGILVVRHNVDVHSPQQLQGQRIAFPAPNALGASLLMRQELLDDFQLGFEAVYAKTHDSVYLNVILGQTLAGGGVRKTLAQQSDTVRSQLKIIHQTAPVAPHPLVFHPRLAEHADAIQKMLMQLASEASVQKYWEQIPMQQPGPAQAADYAPLIDMDLQRFVVSPQS